MAPAGAEGGLLSDEWEPGSRELLQARSALRDDMERELAKNPEARAEIEAEYRAEFAELDARMTERAEYLEAHATWLERVSEDPVAAQMMALTLETKSDEELYAVYRDISSRFAASVPQEAEPQPSEQVPDVDSNRPFTGFADAARAAEERRDPWSRQNAVRGTHENPLGELRRPAGFVPKTVRVRHDDGQRREPIPNDVDPREEASAQTRAEMIRDGLIRQIPGGQRR